MGIYHDRKYADPARALLEQIKSKVAALRATGLVSGQVAGVTIEHLLALDADHTRAVTDLIALREDRTKLQDENAALRSESQPLKDMLATAIGERDRQFARNVKLLDANNGIYRRWTEAKDKVAVLDNLNSTLVKERDSLIDTVASLRQTLAGAEHERLEVVKSYGELQNGNLKIANERKGLIDTVANLRADLDRVGKDRDNLHAGNIALQAELIAKGDVFNADNPFGITVFQDGQKVAVTGVESCGYGVHRTYRVTLMPIPAGAKVECAKGTGKATPSSVNAEPLAAALGVKNDDGFGIGLDEVMEKAFARQRAGRLKLKEARDALTKRFTVNRENASVSALFAILDYLIGDAHD